MATAKDKAVATTNLSPKMQELMAFATELSHSGIVPMAYINKPAAVFAAIQYGKEFGIPPMSAMQNIAVINGKPTLGTDLMVSLAMHHKDWAGYEIPKSDEKAASVTVYRYSPDHKKTFSYSCTFTIEDAQKAGLVRPTSPWEKWRKRMLKHRAMAFAIRDAFPDVLSGTYAYEEMDPDFGADAEMREASALDDIHASILDEKGIPVEIPVGKVEEKKSSQTSGRAKQSAPSRKVAPAKK
jgi:hypothetical protein